MKISSTISPLVLSASLACAAPDRVATVKATVNGMVCSFCAPGILARFKKHPAVSNVHVDLTRKLVLLEERKGKSIIDKEITEHVKKSGFEPVKVEWVKERFDEAKGG
jgi:mercuric ion binding protein